MILLVLQSDLRASMGKQTAVAGGDPGWAGYNKGWELLTEGNAIPLIMEMSMLLMSSENIV